MIVRNVPDAGDWTRRLFRAARTDLQCLRISPACLSVVSPSFHEDCSDYSQVCSSACRLLLEDERRPETPLRLSATATDNAIKLYDIF
jgi:hypothetical protein